MQSVTIIGPQRREFLDVLRFLSQLSPSCQLAHFERLSDALNSDPSNLDDADLVVVLQSHSDQYGRREAERLIGRTVFGRLLCCYGPWCESDGRTREIWPDSIRVPLRLANALIEKELNDCVTGDLPIPPTASRDEVFTHRLRKVSEQRHRAELQQPVNAAVVGPDRILRRMLSMQLTDLGIRSLNIPLIEVQPGVPVVMKETSRGPVHLVLHDLDPWCPLTEASLTAARRMFPSAAVWGIASMPDGGLATETADCKLKRIVPKLDAELGLRWHLQHWSGFSPVSESNQSVSATRFSRSTSNSVQGYSGQQ